MAKFSKKDWLIVTGVLVGLCLLEQIGQWVLSGSAPRGASVLSASKGMGLDFYKSLVFSSFFGFFFLCLFFLLNFILVQKLMGFRVALAIFTAGMFSESLGFLFQGSFAHSFFRVAGIGVSLSHIYVLLGMISIAFFAIKDFSVIFNKNNVRKKLLIEKEQYIFCFYVILPYFLFTIGFYMFFHVFIQMVFVATPRSVPVNIQNDILNTFFSLFSILTICFLLTLVLFVVYFSNKVYGPVYAFKKYIREVVLKGGQERSFKLRDKDHFQDLLNLAKELIQYGKSKQTPDKKTTQKEP